MISPLPALQLGWALAAVIAAAAGEPRFAAGVFLVQVCALVLLDHRPYSVSLALPLHLSLLVAAFFRNTPETAAIVGTVVAVSSAAAMVHQRQQNSG